MKLIAILTISGAILVNDDCFAKLIPINPDFQIRVCNAIYKLEGGNKTKYLYGIKSIKTNNPRQVCLTTIKNNYIRWQKAGSKGNYLDYLANIYCPSSVDKQGNINWKKNIHAIIKDKQK